MKRHELLEKAFKGEIKEGDMFKSELGAVSTFKGNKFVFEPDGKTVGMVASGVEWLPVSKTITVELTQAQINTIYALANHNSADKHIVEGNNRRLDVVSDWDLYEVFEDLVKDGGTN